MERESKAQTSAVLETIRRALGRLATQARVHPIDLSSLAPPASIRQCSVRTGETPRPGLRERQINSKAAAVRFVPPPANAVIAGGAVGGHDAGSLFYCRVSANGAVVPLAESAQLRPVLVQQPAVYLPSIAHPAPLVSAVQAGERLGSASLGVIAHPLVRSKAVVHAVPTQLVREPGPAARRNAWQKSGLPGFSAGRVQRVPPALVERIPMDRQRLPMPSRDSLEWQAAYLQERQLLAHAAGPGVSFSEIDLVGIYRAVPITAARRLEVERGTNSLLLYLRPQMASGSDSTPKTVVSIAIGRVRSDGRLVRSVIRH